MRFLVLVLLVCVFGCGGHNPVYEYRVIEETETGYTMYSGRTMPRMEDGYVLLMDGDIIRFVPIENVEVKRVQIGPHECECGDILQTYRDRCGGCGQMILMGNRKPPEDD